LKSKKNVVQSSLRDCEPVTSIVAKMVFIRRSMA